MFIEMPASKRSMSLRGLIFGVGINDADYMVKYGYKHNKCICPFYRSWTAMIQRCHSAAFLKVNPAYIGCTLSGEWLVFSKYKGWMKKQDWKNKELDKDILFQGNKVYSPETCLFVSREINRLLNNNKARRGAHPQGVSFCKRTGMFISQLNVRGKHETLGYYDVVSDAAKAYKTAKYSLIKQIAIEQSEPLRSALLSYKIK